MNDEDVLVFFGAEEQWGFQPHAGVERLVKLDMTKAEDGFRRLTRQAQRLSEVAREHLTAWEVQSFEIGVTVSGEGNVGFAKARGEAAFTLTLAPRGAGPIPAPEKRPPLPDDAKNVC
jgi:hypothetical protein